ncbi:MAG: hypothetical protein ACREYC_19510 [Gammaproteobacteria bacterium]
MVNGADSLVTGAGAQSNHVRAAAAVASCCGLRCVAVLWGDPPPRVDGNYRVTRMLGADVLFTVAFRRAPRICARKASIPIRSRGVARVPSAP